VAAPVAVVGLARAVVGSYVGDAPTSKANSPQLRKSMIKSISMALAVIVSVFAGQAVAQDVHAANPLLGTWELVKSRDANAADYTDVPKQHRQLALYTPTYFSVVGYDTATKKSDRALGGRYTVSGEDYAEIIEFPAIRGKAVTGNTNLFKVRLEGDRFTKVGTLSSGQKLNEVWQKVK
jgi:hypothetical protein